MGVISLEQTERLYWLGRYTERVFTTLRYYFQSLDEMIEKSDESYRHFCAAIDIPDIYESKADFLRRYPFDAQNSDSLISNLNRAYDNAIVLRESIGSEALSYIQLAIYDMNNASLSNTPLIEMQTLLDHILAFWGISDDQIDSERIRNIIKAGKRIERVDLYARLGVPRGELVREVKRMVPRIVRSGLNYDASRLDFILGLIKAPELDYQMIVSNVEAII